MNYTQGILWDMFPAAVRFRAFQASLRLGLFPAHHCLHWRTSTPHPPFGFSWLVGLPWM